VLDLEVVVPSVTAFAIRLYVPDDTFRGTTSATQQNGDSYLIQEKDVRRFILQHPTEIDLRKVNQLWFLDVITNGLVRAA
jgi:hypothetical protein